MGGVKTVFTEAVHLAMVGVVFAFAANQLSPRGLKLARNYFPAGTNAALPTPATTGSTGGVSTISLTAATPTLVVVPRLAEKGLQAVDTAQATRFFDNPRRAQGLIVFVDARDDQRYREGHIPGAHQLDPYRSEKYIAPVIPVCQSAEQVVVYCTGSECEDSELAAILLRNAGIPNQKLFVYVYGITEWTAGRLPVEIGDRNSGNVRNANK